MIYKPNPLVAEMTLLVLKKNSKYSTILVFTVLLRYSSGNLLKTFLKQIERESTVNRTGMERKSNVNRMFDLCLLFDSRSIHARFPFDLIKRFK